MPFLSTLNIAIFALIEFADSLLFSLLFRYSGVAYFDNIFDQPVSWSLSVSIIALWGGWLYQSTNQGIEGPN